MRERYKLEDTILKIDYDNIKAEVRDKWKYSYFEVGKPVFFDKNVQISRKDFKNIYKDNKVVKSLHEADIYIAKTAPTTWMYFGNKSELKFKDYNNNAIFYLNQINNCIDFINFKGKVVDPKTIEFKSVNGKLPQEMIEKLGNMLNSKDSETFNLGWEILFTYDYLQSIDDFFLLIAKANPQSYHQRRKTRTIEQKLNLIKQNYQNCKI